MKSSPIPFLSILLLCANPGSLPAQQPPVVAGDSTPAQAPAPLRRIISGDVLNLQVVEQPALNKDYGVSGDGTINMETLGRIPVAGLTLEEANRAVKLYLEDRFFKRATVTLNISDHVQGAITVTGDGVANQMQIPHKGDELISLYEAIIRAGGLTARADRTVRILRWKPGQGLQREILEVDLAPMIDRMDFTKDEYLKPKDIVIVRSLGGDESKEVLLLGAVGGMGYHPWHEGLTLLRLLARTGGPGGGSSPESARILRATRGGQYNIIPVDINQLFAGNMAFNYSLVPGDIIYVPLAGAAKQGQVWMFGKGVAREGPVDLPLQGEETISKAILRAGWGPFPRKGSVELRRRGPDGKKLTMTIDVGRILETGDFENDVPLMDGDQVYVPEAFIVP